MARRLPSQPPNLPGFSFVRVLGTGGFADVFLYEQNLPRRRVAVKVLLADIVTSEVRRMFEAEANLMAQLSAHPAVLTIHQAGVSFDGRPYLVMEHCAATFGAQHRTELRPVAEVLRVGVAIAGALETAHRSGVLHRDVKPSNILTTAYGHPVLADFGIAATVGAAESAGQVGVSVPWTAPEVLLEKTTGTITSEVFSLGASVYTLLAGHTPFEAEGGDDDANALAARIARGRVRPIGRPDIPDRLERVVLRALAKRPEDRQSSALEFLRELQAVEAELGLEQTPAEVASDDWVENTASDPDDRTRLSQAARPEHTRRRRRARTGTAPTGGTASGRARRAPVIVTWLVATCAVLVLALAGLATLVLVRSGRAGSIPAVARVDGRVSNGTVVFTWPDPGLRDDDSYQVSVDDGPPSLQKGDTFRVDIDDQSRICLVVSVNRDGRTGPSSPTRCVSTGGSP